MSVLDLPRPNDQVDGRTVIASVWGNVGARSRAFFRLSPLADGERYELSVVSFDLISQEGP